MIIFGNYRFGMKKVIHSLIFLIAFSACTGNFDEKNTRPDVFYPDEVSARYFLSNPQYKLFAPDRYPYWRAHLIHGDRYAGQVCFGHSASWWSDELGYTYNSGYTDASWDWLAGYYGSLENFLKMTSPGGEFDNQYMYAMGLILKGLYYQMFTDIFGMIPYSEAGNASITLPKYDTQKEIYQGIIADLNKAMMLIGDAVRTGNGVNDAGTNDLYFNGNLQKWKKLANALKLRIALRALNAPDQDFARQAITQSLQNPLPETEAENCLLKKDPTISQWNSACYGDVWYNFDSGSDWTLSKPLIDLLRNNNDPRLPKYARPALGGTIKMIRPKGPEAEKFDKRVNFLFGELDASGANYEKTVVFDTVTIVLPEKKYYIGQACRLNDKIKPLASYNLFSLPTQWVIAPKNSGEEIFPEIVLSTAEAYFLRAEAAIRGFGEKNAVEMYHQGIFYAMKLWNVPENEIQDYIATAPLAQLAGSDEEKIEKIALQRWLASYTDGFEAWAIVRQYGYPKELANGVSDGDIFGLGDINGRYPQRLRYGNDAMNKNGEKTRQALSIQGPDHQDTKLWWAK